MEKFECTQCGNCCRFAGPEEAQVEAMGPFYTVSGGDFVGLPLFGWEGKRFREKAEVKLLPQTFLVDKKNKQLIVMRWVLAHNECPMLKEGKCTAYGARGLVCRSFPVLNSGLENIQVQKKFLPTSSKDCPAADLTKIPRPAKANQALKGYWGYWAENYLAAVAVMRADLALKKMAAVLENSPDIEYLSGLEKEDVLELIEGSKWVDLVDAYSSYFKIPAEEATAFTADLENLSAAQEGVERTMEALRKAGS